jgi:ribosomal protein S18 acetylase RimI-like enzyme
MEPSEQPGVLDTDDVLVRVMNENDLEAVVSIDAAATGRRRPEYFQRMIEKALKSSALHISLVAEVDKTVAGFVIGSLYYGEFGVVEPSATIDVIGVAPDFRRQHVGRALTRQLRLNLSALRITTLRTEVSWADFELLAFFQREGFVLADRLCLERKLDPTDPGD